MLLHLAGMLWRLTYKSFFSALLLVSIVGCGSNKDETDVEVIPPNYSNNLRDDQRSYSMWGEKIQDPYHWLENIDDEQVLNWAQMQNKTTFDYISQIPQRAQILQQLEKLLVNKEYKKAKRDGDYYFYTVTLEDPDKEHVYYSSIKDGKEKLFVNPQKFSGNENARFASVSVSPDSKYAAFSLQDPLSRKEKIFIKDLENNRFLSDIVNASYNASMAWDREGGFFYTKGFTPEFSKDSVRHAVFYHSLGQSPSHDIPVFLNTQHPTSSNDIFVTSNGRFVVIRSVIGKLNSEIRYTDLWAPPPNTFKLLTDKAGANPYIVDNIDDKLIVLTYENASHGRVVIIDTKKPDVESWQTLIPEGQDLMQRVYSLDHKFYVKSTQYMIGKITVYDSSGHKISSVELPGNGIVDGFAAKPGYSDVLYTYQSFNYPLTIFKYSPSNNRSEIFKQTENKIKPEDYTVKREFCLTPEGVGIPLLIFHKKELALDGTHPLIFLFSGGMGESYYPGYAMGNIPFVDNDGIIVLASVRGTNESGVLWQQAGMGENKSRMHEDVKLCIDYLMQERYTSPGKIALITKHTGAIAAMETVMQSPGVIGMVGIFQGIFDLLGFQKYKGCISCEEEELGDPTGSQETFTRLKNYSPLQRSYETHQWPAIYLEHKMIDPIVSPVHSFKFIASVQDASNEQSPPKLIRIDNECCLQNRQQEMFILSDRWAFITHVLQMEIK